MSAVPFEPFPKIPRLKREVVITEKIDGTNASIYIGPGPTDDGLALATWTLGEALNEAGAEHMVLRAGSRNRWISPTDDNYGFAKWVQRNAEELRALGPGTHFGEWWGLGIQRGYGMTEKVFSLFNTARWGAHNPNTPACVRVVPRMPGNSWLDVDAALESLRVNGSVAAPGFMTPEGIVVYHSASRQLFKTTLDNNDAAKEAA